MFLNPSDFPFIAHLEANWQSIRQELEQLQPQHFMPWTETFLYETGWDVFGLYAFGHKLPQNCQRCPETTRLVEQIPGMTTAGFSSLAPGTHIVPHVGYTNAVLRCHLGLIVPDGCALRVGEETRQWQAGKALIFDDTVEHEAWHRGKGDRVVLLIDVKRSTADQETHPEVTIPATVSEMVKQLV
jgi:ornithine lipid ester-linked acyl 2-hydroxylase